MTRCNASIFCKEEVEYDNLCTTHLNARTDGYQVDYKGLTEKQCKMCEVTKPVSEFSLKTDKRIKGGKILGSYCKICQRVYNVALNYGITREQLSKMIIANKNICQSCGDYNEMLVVDHDHKCCPTATNRSPACGECIRGLICSRCNTAIGLIESMGSERFNKLQNYLEVK